MRQQQIYVAYAQFSCLARSVSMGLKMHLFAWC